MTTATLRPLTPEDIRALPAVTDAQTTICATFGISPATYWRLLAADDLPCPTFTIGRLRKVKRADLLRAVGEDPNGDGAGAATPTPLAETYSTTSSDQ